MKNGGKNKCCVYNFGQCIYIYIYIYKSVVTMSEYSELGLYYYSIVPYTKPKIETLIFL